MGSNGLFWWIGAGALIVLELLTGTFYLLMIALGLIAGGLAHVFGASVDAQFALAALVALAAVVALRRSRLGRIQRRDASGNPDVNLDIGATLAVEQWHDRRARTQYRGAEWEVELAPGEREDARFYEITALRGNCLIVAAKRQAARA
jgi:membrane protein implicated in regulation of membrane protease activity